MLNKYPRVLINFSLSSFQIKEVLGKGSFGTVYRVVKKDSKDPIKEYAIKVLKKSSRNTQLKEDKVLKEWYNKIKKCCPTCVVTIYPNLIKAEVYNDTYYLIIGMDYIPKTLNHPSIFKFPLEKKIEIVLQLGECLKNLANNGLIYTDLKPSNIGITDDNKPIILDLGGFEYFLIKRFGEGSGNVQGTLKYLPPEWKEIFSNFSKEKLTSLLKQEKEDKKGLVYSLTKILLFLLRNEDHSRDELEIIDTLSLKPLKELLRRSLSANRAQRPSLEEFLTELKLIYSLLNVSTSFSIYNKKNNSVLKFSSSSKNFPKNPKPISLKEFAYAFHSECGIVIDHEVFKGLPLYGRNFNVAILNGIAWENWVLLNFKPLLDWKYLPFTSSGSKTLNEVLNSFIHYIQRYPKEKFYITDVPVDIGLALQSLNLENLEKKYIPLFGQKVRIDLLEVEKQNSQIVLTVYEIKSSGKVKPYHIIQASFYSFLLEETFKNTLVKINREIKIIYRQPDGFKIYKKITADKRQLFTSFLKKTEDLLGTKNLTPFVKPFCLTRDCQKLRIDCFNKATANLSVSLFKSLKKERQKLFQSGFVDTSEKLLEYIELLEGLKQPLGFDKEAFLAELKLYQQHGIGCGLDFCSLSNVKATQYRKNFLSKILAENILYIDVIYGDIAPVGIGLIISTPKNSMLDRLMLRHKKLSKGNRHIYPIMFNFSCKEFSYDSYVWKRFQSLLIQLVLFREKPLTVIFRNEEAQKAIENLLHREIENKIAANSSSQLNYLIEVWEILKGVDYVYNLSKKLRVYILEDLINHIWQTNEPFTFKLPSFIAINNLLKDNTKTFKGSPYTIFGCPPEQSQTQGNNVQDKKVELGEEEILKKCYNALAPYEPSCIYTAQENNSFRLKVPPDLWDYTVLTGLWGVNLLLNSAEGSNEN
jgi:serine/threonine protein kinase